MKQFFLLPLAFLLSLSPAIAQEDATDGKDPIFGTTLPNSNDPFAGSPVAGTGAKTINPGPKSGIQSNPIDGGVSVLLITGALYGAKRYRNARRKPSTV